GAVRFRTADRTAWREYRGALVMPHGPHQFDGNEQSVAQLFVEPETAQGRALLERHGGRQIVSLDDELSEQVSKTLHGAYAARASDEALVAAGRKAVTLLSGGDPALEVDPRNTRAIEWMGERLHS